MIIPKQKLPTVIIVLYLLSVGFCIIKAFDFDGAINPAWTLVLIVLTLPWSISSIFFAWALIHGAGLEFFAFLYSSYAGVNALIFYWICRVARKRNSRRTESIESSGR